MKKILLTTILMLGTISFLLAQRSDGALGIGAQGGQPSGLSIKVYKPQGISPEILLAWDLNEFFFVNVHGLYERHIGSSEYFHYFIGPGLFAGFTDRNDFNFEAEDYSFGLSANAGLNVILGPVELFAQITPRLNLTDSTTGTLGGGAGIRFYLN